MASKLILTERKDMKWGWALVGDNGSDIIATDGGQGYENMREAQEMAEKVINGHYGNPDILFEKLPRA